MSDPAVAAALLSAFALVCSALIYGIFGMAGRRNEAADDARRELLADKNERIDMLTVERDEARADRDECRRQVLALEARIVEIEGRSTRGVKP